MQEIKLVKVSTESTDREALGQAIEKYRNMKNIVDGGDFPINTGEESCSLCQKYNHYEADPNKCLRCIGCPIHRATGRVKCEGTPFHDIHFLSLAILKDPSVFETEKNHFMALCDKEIKFLEETKNSLKT